MKYFYTSGKLGSSQKQSANGLPKNRENPEIPYKCRKILLFYGITRVCHLIRQKWSPDGLHFVVSMQFFQYLSAL